eukprot:6186186-Pleurochrysis_carterae.AAC.2
MSPWNREESLAWANDTRTRVPPCAEQCAAVLAPGAPRRHSRLIQLARAGCGDRREDPARRRGPKQASATDMLAVTSRRAEGCVARASAGVRRASVCVDACRSRASADLEG